MFTGRAGNYKLRAFTAFSALDLLSFFGRSNDTVPNFSVLLESHKNYPGHISPNSKEQQLQITKITPFLWPFRILIDWIISA